MQCEMDKIFGKRGPAHLVALMPDSGVAEPGRVTGPPSHRGSGPYSGGGDKCAGSAAAEQILQSATDNMDRATLNWENAMKLIINRSYEAPSRKTPASYSYRAILELTDEEKMLVEQYNLQDYVLTQTQSYHTTKIGDLMRGRTNSLSDLSIVMGNEQALRGACEGLPTLFAYCRSFGENFVVEYPS